MSIENIREEYETQDNKGNEYPFYVEVQELMTAGVIDTNYTYKNHDCIIEYENLNECMQYEDNCSCDCDNCVCTMKENLKPVMSVWIGIEIFLTIKSAKKWIKLNKHNFGKLRTYIKHFHRDNIEIREVLKEVGLKVE